MIGIPPVETLLLAIAADVAAPDYAAEIGIALPKPVTARHMRGRFATDEEYPAISIEWVGDAVGEGGNLSMWETQRELTVTLNVEGGVATDASGADPTGFGVLSRLGAVAVQSIMTLGSNVSQWADRIYQNDISPDETPSPDEGRLILSITVVYRVKTDNPNVLLPSGVNAT